MWQSVVGSKRGIASNLLGGAKRQGWTGSYQRGVVADNAMGWAAKAALA
jgi:hypothetical protein